MTPKTIPRIAATGMFEDDALGASGKEVLVELLDSDGAAVDFVIDNVESALVADGPVVEARFEITLVSWTCERTVLHALTL